MNNNRPTKTPRSRNPSKEEQHRAAERNFWKRHIKAACGLNIITFLGAAAAIGGLWILYETLVESNRAWIAPTHIIILSEVKENEPLKIEIVYDNIGKEPALNLVFKSISYYVDIPPPNSNWFIKGGINETCKQLVVTDTEGTVIYPSSEHPYNSVFITQKLDKSVTTDKAKLLIVEGCYAYRSFWFRRESAYCFVLHPPGINKPGDWGFEPCFDGNYAN